MENKRYPRLVCDLPRLRRNVIEVTTRCHDAGIKVAGVIKGVNCRIPMVEQFVKGGCDQLATSRMEQIRLLKEHFPELPTLLVRVPMMSELEEVARLCDYSLESDLDTLRALEGVCAGLGLPHKVILMVDLGDLREGWWRQEELVAAALEVERQMPHLELAGVGTLLNDFAGIMPTVDKMESLAALAQRVEEAIGRELEIVSGGATSSFVRVHRGEMPKKINHLRIGEGILLSYDMQHLWGVEDADYLSTHVFTLQAQVLECREKPSYPVGEPGTDAFGNVPVHVDRGIRLRAVAGMGRVDFGDAECLVPRLPGLEVVGATSDHTMLDVTDCAAPPRAGDVVEFDLRYVNMVFLTGRGELAIEYLEE